MGSTGGRNETFPEDRGRENKGQEVGVLQQEEEREMGGGGDYSKMVNTTCHSV